MEEIHEGICSSHQGPKTLARKIILQGYYWPTIQQDCFGHTKKCKICQLYAPVPGRPATFYTPMTISLPFARWGIDLLGPLPTATGGRKYIIVGIDYFTKWVEAEPLASITEFQCQRFVWQNIICRFGLPEQVITDNGRQFVSKNFEEFLARWGVKHSRASVAYPQANGQVENMNRTIMDGIKKKLEDYASTWPEQLNYVLWTYRTTPRTATGETPFALAYGFQAKVPTEVLVPTHRTIHYDPEQNEDNLRAELHFIEERRDLSALRMEEYHRATKRYVDKQAKIRSIEVGDLVLRNREKSKPLEGGKMSKNWEGPYRVWKKYRIGTFFLQDTEGCPAGIWNATHLRKFYQ
ncbi:unnamed protein product [Cuscuta epithymum]|uniref:Integrase catalytic domain-containing protein n=1 Tax=Cuscuta epithymum TaxID=186058 RepID=A0AAV0FVG3_9ASTE|nr:unnamed protein product [Cuscuta epithymum]